MVTHCMYIIYMSNRPRHVVAVLARGYSNEMTYESYYDADTQTISSTKIQHCCMQKICLALKIQAWTETLNWAPESTPPPV